ncbi:MAG: 50S ribosomal protein L22 [Candidatus Dadabacteria bacterium]|nr:50S ribosomal protein L22 [Candidatus Dadabacteria bacterium]NIQ15164.1 50S ribosomal protein L22 [Candidatus Dadabacteria bacterium]
MVSKAILKHMRVSPKKARIVLDLIRGKNVEDAFSILFATRKKSSPLIAKLLKSAVANASEKGHSDTESLYIKEAYANKGQVIKRFRARAMGRAFSRKSRMSHVTIVLDERGL